MDQQIPQTEDEKYTQLRTMIPCDVYLELTEFAKSHTTITGAWDYGNAIRELLWSYKVFYNINTRLDEMEIQLNEMKSELIRVDNKPKSSVETEKKNDNVYGLLGKHYEKETK